MANHFTATEETEARALLQHVLEVINSTDCDHEDFLDSGADSIDLLWQIEPRLKALLGVPQRPAVEAAEAMSEAEGIQALRAAIDLIGTAEPVTQRERDEARGRALLYVDQLAADLFDRTDVDIRTASPAPAVTAAAIGEALGGPVATEARIASEADRIAYAASEHDEFPINPMPRLARWSAKRSGQPLSEETKCKLRDRAGVGPEALARVRRDAQNIARRMAEESTNSSAGAAGDLDAIDARVDLLLRNVDNLADAVDRLGAILEAR